MDERIEQLEKPIAALEAQALLFEEHRSAWVKLNFQLQALHDELQKDKGVV